MATNDFLPFGGGSGANVLTQAQYAALAALGPGFSSGVAQSAACNKVWRQASIMAAVLAQMIVDNTGQNAVDDGTTTTLLANLKLATSGRLLGIQRFTSSGTYTPTTGVRNIRVRAISGGGGGGGCPATAAGQCAVSSGGTAGTYVELFMTNPGTQSIAIGAAGSAGIAGSNNGGNGGVTSMGSLISLPGGNGGIAGSAGAPPFLVRPPNATSGITTTGTTLVVTSGIAGGPGLALSTASFNGGGGGTSPVCVGQTLANGPGVVGSGLGAGGSGAAIGASSSAVAGGPGLGGIMIIEEYA